MRDSFPLSFILPFIQHRSMEILQTLRERYTTKAYDPTFDLSDEQLSQIREILRLCPS